jgi:hypothetical protein
MTTIGTYIRAVWKLLAFVVMRSPSPDSEV